MPGIGKAAIVIGLLVALALCAGPAPAAPPRPDLEKARALILEGRGAEAWAMLEPYEFQLAGEEDYDYLLGVAAIAAGHPARATLALERVLIVDPNHLAARLDMGRAYFALGDYERARVELEDLLRHDPPPAARATIERYLAAIAVRTRRAGVPRVSGYVEAAAGYDSNINAGISQGTLFLPLFGATFTLAPSAVRQRDGFAALGGGLEVAVPLTERWSLVGGADLRQRAYSSQSAYDFRSLDLRGGVLYARASDSVRAMFGANRYDLDYSSYRRIEGVSGEWRHDFDRLTQVSVYAQDLRIRYLQAATRAQSSDLLLLGIGAIRTLDEATRTFAFGSVFAGTDNATDGRIDGDRDLYGVRAGMQRALRGDIDAFAVGSAQKSLYRQVNVIFDQRRVDWQYDLAVGLVVRFGLGWSLRPQLLYTRNDSIVPINDYDRYEASLALRREWR